MRLAAFTAIMPLALLVTVVVLTLISYYDISIQPVDQQGAKWANEVNGIYEASATILVITSLASILSVKISSDRDKARIQHAGIVMVIGNNIVIILTQITIMLGLCCTGLEKITYFKYMGITGVSLIFIALGYYLMSNIRGGGRQDMDYDTVLDDE